MNFAKLRQISMRSAVSSGLRSEPTWAFKTECHSVRRTGQREGLVALPRFCLEVCLRVVYFRTEDTVPCEVALCENSRILVKNTDDVTNGG